MNLLQGSRALEEKRGVQIQMYNSAVLNRDFHRLKQVNSEEHYKTPQPRILRVER